MYCSVLIFVRGCILTSACFSLDLIHKPWLKSNISLHSGGFFTMHHKVGESIKYNVLHFHLHITFYYFYSYFKIGYLNHTDMCTGTFSNALCRLIYLLLISDPWILLTNQKINPVLICYALSTYYLLNFNLTCRYLNKKVSLKF